MHRGIGHGVNNYVHIYHSSSKGGHWGGSDIRLIRYHRSSVKKKKKKEEVGGEKGESKESRHDTYCPLSYVHTVCVVGMFMHIIHMYVCTVYVHTCTPCVHTNL